MRGRKNWRLSKTLSRRVEIRPIENDDVKYVWAAYKKGKFSELFQRDLSPAEFKFEFEKFVLANVHAALTILADTKVGFMPIGIALGQWGPAFLIMSDIEWFPWASCRNTLEGTVALFNRLRKQTPVFGFVKEEHKPIYEVCLMHGIMRRIGTSHSLGTRMTLFEVRTE